MPRSSDRSSVRCRGAYKWNCGFAGLEYRYIRDVVGTLYVHDKKWNVLVDDHIRWMSFSILQRSSSFWSSIKKLIDGSMESKNNRSAFVSRAITDGEEQQEQELEFSWIELKMIRYQNFSSYIDLAHNERDEILIPIFLYAIEILRVHFHASHP